jgi:hypothetical protein
MRKIVFVEDMPKPKGFEWDILKVLEILKNKKGNLLLWMVSNYESTSLTPSKRR